MRKGLFYICLLLVGVGLFAGCKSKKAVVASFSDLDGEWGVVEMNGKTLNPDSSGFGVRRGSSRAFRKCRLQSVDGEDRI